MIDVQSQKLESIKNSLLRFEEKYYRKESFVYIINVGLSTTVDMTLSFADLKRKLIQIYNDAA